MNLFLKFAAKIELYSEMCFTFCLKNVFKS